jgi:hypothetical protein
MSTFGKGDEGGFCFNFLYPSPLPLRERIKVRGKREFAIEKG